MTVRAEAEITLVRTDDGNDGYSPTATVTKAGDTATITITDINGTTSETVTDGQDGSPGISVTAVQTQYYLSTSDASATGGSWTDDQPEFESGKFYWTRDKISYSNGTTDYSTPIYNQGLTLANEYALSASQSALSAYNASSQAANQLSVVEDIVGVLDLISKNGTYELTEDEAPQDNKWYFVRSGTGTSDDPYIYSITTDVYIYALTSDVAIDLSKIYYTRSGSGTDVDPYVYTPVDEPDVSDIGTYYELESPASLGYYELTGVDQSIQNYVSSHLVLVGNSLFLQTDQGNNSTRLELNTTNGMILYDQSGHQIAQYGSEVVLGSDDSNASRVRVTPSALSFEDSGMSVASISQNTLAINNAVIDNKMKMGNFEWTINGDGRLLLKYIGA